MRKLTLIVPLSTLVIMTVLLVMLAMSKPSQEKLEQALAGADRLVITPVPLAYENKSDMPKPIELAGAEKVKEFLDCVEISGGQGQCKCMGDVEIAFYKGDKPLATISFHHKTHLRWHDGEWDDEDAVLSGDSREALIEWLEGQGFRFPEEE